MRKRAISKCMDSIHKEYWMKKTGAERCYMIELMSPASA